MSLLAHVFSAPLRMRLSPIWTSPRSCTKKCSGLCQIMCVSSLQPQQAWHLNEYGSYSWLCREIADNLGCISASMGRLHQKPIIVSTLMQTHRNCRSMVDGPRAPLRPSHIWLTFRSVQQFRSVQKNAVTGKVEVASPIFRITDIENEAGWSLFPATSKNSFAYVSMDPMRRMCRIWYHAFVPYW